MTEKKANDKFAWKPGDVEITKNTNPPLAPETNRKIADLYASVGLDKNGVKKK